MHSPSNTGAANRHVTYSRARDLPVHSYTGYLLRGTSPDSIAPVYEPSSFASRTKREKAGCGSQTFRIAERSSLRSKSSVESGNRQGRQFRNSTLIQVANVPIRPSADQTFVMAIPLTAISMIATHIWVGGFRDSELRSRNQELRSASRISRRRFHSGISLQKRCSLVATQLKFSATRVCVTSASDLDPAVPQSQCFKRHCIVFSAFPLPWVAIVAPLVLLHPIRGGLSGAKSDERGFA